MNVHIKTKPAITLIETLVYLALFGIFITIIMQFALSTAEYNAVTRETGLVQRSLLFLNQHFVEQVDLVESVDEVDSIPSTHPGRLTFDTPSSTVTYSLNGGRIQRTESGVSEFLTSTEFSASNFVFELLRDDDDNIIGIIVDLTLQSNDFGRVNGTLRNLYKLN